MVTPFRLANDPSTLQKHINWALCDFANESVSAYLDDISIFPYRPLVEHQEHVRKVLKRLQEAGLRVAIDKCKFDAKKIDTSVSVFV